MPITQVSAMSGEQWLSAPFPPQPDLLAILREWRRPMWDASLRVYPAGYMGNVSPERWHESSNFLLSVDDTGERAEMLAIGKLPEQQLLPDFIAELRDATPEQKQAIGSTAIVGTENKCIYVSTMLPNNRLAIGGVVLHADRDELIMLQGLFPEVEP